MGIETAMQNLQYVQKKLLNDSYKKDKALLIFAVEQALEAVHQTPFKYVVGYGKSEKKRGHIPTYTAMAKTYKAKAIASLEDLQCELTSLQMNLKRCLVLVSGLLETRLYIDSVHRKMDVFQYGVYGVQARNRVAYEFMMMVEI